MSFARLPLIAVLGLFFVFALDREPAQSENPSPSAPKEWVRTVRLSLRVEGDGRDAYLELPLVPTDGHQTLIEESLETRGFEVEEVEREGNRLAILTHPALEGKKRITYEFKVRVRPTKEEVPRVPVAASDPPREDWLWLRPTKQLQSASPLIREKLITYARPRLAAGDDDALRLAWDLVETGYRAKADGSRTVLKATRTGHAAPRGQERLYATFLRTSGVPARPVFGIDLARKAKTRSSVWVEAKADGRWIPMSVSRELWGELPARYLKLAHGDRPFIVREGVKSLSFRWKVSRPGEVPEVVEP